MVTNLENVTIVAPRPERSSFCEEERRVKKREWRAEIGAIKIFIISREIVTQNY